MFVLDHQLAQQIVERTMSIIGNNINVMSQSGVIIGSGSKERIGEAHDGALLALKHGHTVELTQETCKTLKGVKPGINLVLRSAEDIIGVVGITGDPEHIRNYANLVKMTAEMIVEQASLIEQLQWDRRYREEFITAWISGQQPINELADWARRLDLDIRDPRVAVVIRLCDAGAPLSMSGIRQVVELLEHPKRDNLVAVISMQEIVVLKPATFKDGDWDSGQESERIDALLTRLKHQVGIHVDIALGHYFPNPEQIHLSYQSARQTLHLGKKQKPHNHKFLYDDFRLPVLLSPLQANWQGEQICSPFQHLIDNDSNGQLFKTIEQLFNHHGELSKCAKALFIHRNTLRYRINKIKKVTGVDPEELDGLMQLYIGYLLHIECDV